MSNALIAFGMALRCRRKMAGLSLRALAIRTGGIVSAMAISKYERGVSVPSSRVLLAMESVVGVVVPAHTIRFGPKVITHRFVMDR